jgi:hypothetical protein
VRLTKLVHIRLAQVVHPSQFAKLVLSITACLLRLVHFLRQQLCQGRVFGHVLIDEVWRGDLIVLIFEVLDVIFIFKKLELLWLHILFLLGISSL